MTMETKRFHLGDVLSITTGRLVSPRHIGGVYDILNFMTGDNLMTHQLGRASGECEPELLRQHPDLAAIEVPEQFDPVSPEHHVRWWLQQQVDRFGEYLDVTPLAAEDHTVIDPLAEIRMIKPDMQVIDVEIGGED